MTQTPTQPENRLRVWGVRLFKAVIAVAALYLTWHFITHSRLDWWDEGTPEVDSMLLLAEQLVPHLYCTLPPR